MTQPEYQREVRSSTNKVALSEIEHKMQIEKLPDSFISAALKTAEEYEGVFDLLQLWLYEDTMEERDEIIADIQDLIDDCQLNAKEEVLNININDLEWISKSIRKFKDSLLSIVDQNGGISHLAELTEIPQPSLARFFSSNAMPRQMTFLKIAKALNLNTDEINFPWAK